MVKKIDELSEDNINDLSKEELAEIALSGKEELISARGVIGSLNKKTKQSSNDPSEPITQDKLDEALRQREKQKELDNFVSKNPVFEDYKSKLSETIDTGLFDSVSEASQFLLSKDKTLQNNLNTNQAGSIQGTGTSNSFGGKITLDDYESMTKSEKQSYKEHCNQKFGGITFSTDMG